MSRFRRGDKIKFKMLTAIVTEVSPEGAVTANWDFGNGEFQHHTTSAHFSDDFSVESHAEDRIPPPSADPIEYAALVEAGETYGGI